MEKQVDRRDVRTLLALVNIVANYGGEDDLVVISFCARYNSRVAIVKHVPKAKRGPLVFPP